MDNIAINIIVPSAIILTLASLWELIRMDEFRWLPIIGVVIGLILIFAVDFFGKTMKITKGGSSDQHKPVEGVTVAFPRNYSDQISKEVVATRGLGGCLYIFNPAEWNEVKGRFKELELGHRLTDNQAKLFNLMVKGAYCAEISKEDTLFIPGFLREYARIKKDIVSIETGNHLEIWAKEKFEKRGGMKLS